MQLVTPSVVATAMRMEIMGQRIFPVGGGNIKNIA